MTPIPFKEIQEAALPYVEALCRRWLPDGRKQGSWWVAAVPWRKDTNPSLGVSLTTGKWKDFAGQDRGDICDLFRMIYNVTPVEAARSVARVVGHDFAA